jgi:CheY-like chemotaxis protein
MGAQTIAASDGQKAIETLESDPKIQLVLMDIMMPGMDGFQAMREIRRRDPIKHVPIIALTAKAMREDRDACLAAGANDYLPKPVDVDQLALAAKSWIGK